ncbi:MAG: hypothetical protein R2724_03075 [Bryobacterales bacterium]
MRLIFWLLLPAALMGGEQPWVRHAIDSSSRAWRRRRALGRRQRRRILLDIATGWEEGGRVRAYLNPGAAKTKQPWPAVTVGDVGSPEDAVFVDLDSDGAWDVVSSTEGSSGRCSSTGLRVRWNATSTRALGAPSPSRLRNSWGCGCS